MSLVPFTPAHIVDIGPRLQRSQRDLHRFYSLTEAYGEGLLAGGPCWTVLDASGRPAACGGFYRQWEGRAIAWAFLTKGAPMLAITRAVLEVLAQGEFLRVECWVDVDFQAGHRWAALLGFEREGLMRSFGLGGRDNVLYARIR